MKMAIWEIFRICHYPESRRSGSFLMFSARQGRYPLKSGRIHRSDSMYILDRSYRNNSRATLVFHRQKANSLESSPVTHVGSREHQLMSLLFRRNMSDRNLRSTGSGSSKNTEILPGLVQKSGKGNTLGLLSFKPQQKFWSKFEPKAKGKSPGEMGKSESLKIDVRKQTKVRSWGIWLKEKVGLEK